MINKVNPNITYQCPLSERYVNIEECKICSYLINIDSDGVIECNKPIENIEPEETLNLLKVNEEYYHQVEVLDDTDNCDGCLFHYKSDKQEFCLSGLKHRCYYGHKWLKFDFNKINEK